MSLDQALCREVALLLSQSEDKDAQKANKSKVGHAASLAEQASMFATTWNLISSSLDPSSRSASGENPGNHDLGTVLSAIRESGNVNAEHSDCRCSVVISKNSNRNDVFGLCDPAKVPECAYVYDFDPSSNSSVGAPSNAESFHGIGIGFSLQEACNVVDEHLKEVNKRTSSRILNNCPPKLSNQNSRLVVDSSESKKTVEKKRSAGMNEILKCSSDVCVVGCSHRSSAVPRCAFDYVRMIRDCQEESEDIPSGMYKYLIGPNLQSSDNIGFNTQSMIRDNTTPVIKEGSSPINKSFLSSVNDELKKIQHDQAVERSLYGFTNSKRGDIYNANLLGRGNETYSAGMMNKNSVFVNKKHTTIIDNNARNQVKTDSGMQTGVDDEESETVQNSAARTPTVWGQDHSQLPSHMCSLSAVRERNLGCRRLRGEHIYPINPEATSEESLRICEQHQQLQRRIDVANRASNGMFRNLLSFNTALGITKYSLQAAWNTAEEIFRGYIVPPETMEDREPVVLTNEEREENENKISVALMRLMGLPMDSRQTIYREILGDVQAIHEFSVETVQLISNIIDWICSGSHSGTEDLVAKTRLFAASQTEVDLDSEGWRNFERDVGIFTTAVTSAVGDAARMVSRQCTDSAASLRRISTGEDPSNVSIDLDQVNSCSVPTSVMSINSGTTGAETNDDDLGSTASRTTQESEFDATVNPALIAEMVTESEFEFPLATSASPSHTESRIVSIAGTASMASTSSNNGQRRLSGIPVPVYSKTVPATPNSVSANKNNLKLASAWKSNLNSQAERQRTNPIQKASFQKLNQGKDSREVLLQPLTNQKLPDQQGKGKDPEYKPEHRELMLSMADSQLFRECRRLTDVSSSASATRTDSSIEESGTGSNYSTARQSAQASDHKIPNIEGDITDVKSLASAIATVASCVTSSLLGRAANAASYVPSFQDTFGPQVDEEYRFPESIMEVDVEDDSILESIQKAANTASNILFGLKNTASAESTTVASRPSNRNIRSRNTLSPPIKFASAENSNNTASSPAQPRIIGSSHRVAITPGNTTSSTQPEQQQQQQQQQQHAAGSNSRNLIRQESVNNNSIMIDDAQVSATNVNTQLDIDPAWQLFDYIKLQEAEYALAKQNADKPSPHLGSRKSSDFGITDQSPPRSEHTLPNGCITARLSKAALHGLFNAFQESDPPTRSSNLNLNTDSANAISGNYGNQAENGDVGTARIGEGGSISETISTSQIFNKASVEGAAGLLKVISNGDLQDNEKRDYYRTQSGHSYLLNSRRSPSQSAMNMNHAPSTSSFQSPSVPRINVPHNSDIDISRQMAEIQMYDDITYLENIVNALYESKLIENRAHVSDTTHVPAKTENVMSKPQPPPKPAQAPSANSPQKIAQEKKDVKGPLKSPGSQLPRRRVIRSPSVRSPSPMNTPLNQSKQSSQLHVPYLNAGVKVKSLQLNTKPELSSSKKSTPIASCLPSPQPRIVHQTKPSLPTRSKPIKPPIKIISAVPGLLSRPPTPTYPTITPANATNSLCVGTEASSTNDNTLITGAGTGCGHDPESQRPWESSVGNPGGQGPNSYLKIANKQKSSVSSRVPVMSQNRLTLKSYSSRQNSSSQIQGHGHEVSSHLENLNGSNGISTASRNHHASRNLGSQSRCPANIQDDSTHSVNSACGSSKFSFTTSSLPPSNRSSRHHRSTVVGKHDHGKTASDKNMTQSGNDAQATSDSSNSSPSGLVFFPPLENNSSDTFPRWKGVLNTAFTRLRDSDIL